MMDLRLLKLWFDVKIGRHIAKYFKDENGATSIVAIVILIGITLVLAIIFKDAIIDLLQGLFAKIRTNADNAIETTAETLQGVRTFRAC